MLANQGFQDRNLQISQPKFEFTGCSGLRFDKWIRKFFIKHRLWGLTRFLL